MPRSFAAGDMHAWEWPGEPPGALLLHGIGNYGRYWDFFAEAVAGHLRLVAPDARGHGESANPPDGYAPADFVSDAISVMDASGLARPVVVGHSMGGFHAAALALAHPDRLRGLVIIDTGPGLAAPMQERARRLTLERPDRFPNEAAALAYLKQTSPGYSEAVYENRLEFAFRRFADGALEWRSSKDGLRQILDGIHRNASADVWDHTGEIDVPVLLVRGTRSPTFSEDRARATIAPLRSAKLIELDAGHNVPLDRPRELADAVLEFARGLR